MMSYRNSLTATHIAAVLLPLSVFSQAAAQTAPSRLSVEPPLSASAPAAPEVGQSSTETPANEGADLAETAESAPAAEKRTADPESTEGPLAQTERAASPVVRTSVYPVRVVSVMPGLELRVHPIVLGDVTHSPTQDWSVFRATCSAPCETTLPSGAYQVGFSTPEGGRALASTGLMLDGPATVTAEVISHDATRRRGWYWVLIGSGIGALATTVGLAQNCGPDQDCAKSASLGIWGGITAISVSWVIGMPMIRTDDEASIHVTPNLEGSAVPGGRSAAVKAATRNPQLAGMF